LPADVAKSAFDHLQLSEFLQAFIAQAAALTIDAQATFTAAGTVYSSDARFDLVGVA